MKAAAKKEVLRLLSWNFHAASSKFTIRVKKTALDRVRIRPVANTKIGKAYKKLCGKGSVSEVFKWPAEKMRKSQALEDHIDASRRHLECWAAKTEFILRHTKTHRAQVPISNGKGTRDKIRNKLTAFVADYVKDAEKKISEVHGEKEGARWNQELTELPKISEKECELMDLETDSDFSASSASDSDGGQSSTSSEEGDA